jgi:arylsulfatase A-like enzyme
MNLRFLTGIVALLFCLAAVNMVLAAPLQAQQHNVVVIYMDDLDNNASKGFVPKLQALVGGKGIIFNNAFVTTPACGPSRVSLHTGLLAHNHGIWGTEVGGGWGAFRPLLSNSLGVWMQNAGYRTGFYGKLMNGFTARDGYQVPGWDHYAIYDFSGGAYHYFNYRLFEKPWNQPSGRSIQYGTAASDYLTDILAKKTINFITKSVADAKPFFVILAPLAPHSPATPAPRHVGYHDTTPFPHNAVFNEADISDKPKPIRDLPLLTQSQINGTAMLYRRKLDSLMAVDEAGEQIIKTLAALGVLENTDILVTSDNGFSFGDHRWVFKMTQYDGTVRVPLFWRGPGIPAGATRDQFVSNVDVTATILARTGGVPPRELDGQSFASILKPTGASRAWRSGVFIEDYLSDERFPEQGYRYWEVQTPVRMFGEVRGPNYVQRESYDMTLDPFQATNTVLSMPADARAQWAALVQGLKSCRGANCNNF